MAMLGRNASVTLNLTAGQSIAVGSPGPGNSRVYTAAASTGNVPPIFALFATVTNGATFLTFAAATTVMIEASNGNEVEYDFGTQPALTIYPSIAVASGLVAKVGGGQSGATALTGNVNRISTVATAADSVLLPPAVAGRHVSVYNAGANSTNVFPQVGEAINSGAANAAFAVATTKSAIFECGLTGTWNATLSA